MGLVKIFKVVCKKCSHSWVPRQEEIHVCPKCKNPGWDKEPKKYEVIKVKEGDSFEEIFNKMGKSKIFNDEMMLVGGM